MTPDERDKLYHWLEHGRCDIWLRRMMKERLAELEAALPSDSELLDYVRPEVADPDEPMFPMPKLDPGLRQGIKEPDDKPVSDVVRKALKFLKSGKGTLRYVGPSAPRNYRDPRVPPLEPYSQDIFIMENESMRP